MSEPEQALEIPSSPNPNVKNTHEALSTLATASRTDPTIRTQLAEPAILTILTALITESITASAPESTAVALRCIGNACIDNPAARTTLSNQGFGWATQCLSSSTPAVRQLAVLVLVNACMDHEAAQQACYRAGVHEVLVDVVGDAAAWGEGQGERHFPIEVLLLIVGQKEAVEKAAAEEAAEGEVGGGELEDGTLRELLRLPGLHSRRTDGEEGTDDEDYAMVLESVLTFLRDPKIQARVTEAREVDVVWEMLRTNERQIALAESETDVKELLIPLSTSLTWCLSDIAANERFSEMYAPTTEGALMESVESSILRAPSSSGDAMSSDRMVNAACQVLGNWLWALPVEITTPYVEEKNIHVPLWHFLETTDSADLMHSVSGLLIQLTRPSADVREKIGSAENAHSALQRLCRHATKQVKEDGIKLLRILGKECPANQQKFAVLAKEVMDEQVAAAQAAAENPPAEDNGQPMITATT